MPSEVEQVFQAIRKRVDDKNKSVIKIVQNSAKRLIVAWAEITSVSGDGNAIQILARPFGNAPGETVNIEGYYNSVDPNAAVSQVILLDGPRPQVGDTGFLSLVANTVLLFGFRRRLVTVDPEPETEARIVVTAETRRAPRAAAATINWTATGIEDIESWLIDIFPGLGLEQDGDQVITIDTAGASSYVLSPLAFDTAYSVVVSALKDGQVAITGNTTFVTPTEREPTQPQVSIDAAITAAPVEDTTDTIRLTWSAAVSEQGLPDGVTIDVAWSITQGVTEILSGTGTTAMFREITGLNANTRYTFVVTYTPTLDPSVPNALLLPGTDSAVARTGREMVEPPEPEPEPEPPEPGPEPPTPVVKPVISVFQAVPSGSDTINLTWDITGAESVSITRNGTPLTGVTVDGPYADSGLDPGTYTYVITATNSAGSTTASDAATIRAVALNVEPSVTNIQTRVVGTTITVTWEVSGGGIRSQTVTVNGEAQSVTPGQRSLTVPNLDRGATYEIEITATNDVGTATSSASVTIPRLPPINVPRNVVCTNETVNQITLSWDPAIGATRLNDPQYEIRYRSENESTWTNVRRQATTTYTTPATLAANTVYIFEIRTRDGTRTSARVRNLGICRTLEADIPAPLLTLRSPRIIPTRPTNTLAVDASWTRPAGATLFEIQVARVVRTGIGSWIDNSTTPSLSRTIRATVSATSPFAYGREMAVRVRARVGTRNSPWSTPKTIRWPNEPLDPTIGTVTRQGRNNGIWVIERSNGEIICIENEGGFTMREGLRVRFNEIPNTLVQGIMTTAAAETGAVLSGAFVGTYLALEIANAALVSSLTSATIGSFVVSAVGAQLANTLGNLLVGLTNFTAGLAWITLPYQGIFLVALLVDLGGQEYNLPNLVGLLASIDAVFKRYGVTQLPDGTRWTGVQIRRGIPSGGPRRWAGSFTVFGRAVSAGYAGTDDSATIILPTAAVNFLEDNVEKALNLMNTLIPNECIAARNSAVVTQVVR